MQRFEMKAPSEWLDAVDQWRATQRGLPPRAEAIRRLIDKALTASEDTPAPPSPASPPPALPAPQIAPKPPETAVSVEITPTALPALPPELGAQVAHYMRSRPFLETEEEAIHDLLIRGLADAAGREGVIHVSPDAVEELKSLKPHADLNVLIHELIERGVKDLKLYRQHMLASIALEEKEAIEKQGNISK